MQTARHHPGMGKKPIRSGKKPVPKRKAFRYVRVKEPAASLAASLAGETLGSLSAWVTTAVVEKLKREGRWPPPAPSQPVAT